MKKLLLIMFMVGLGSFAVAGTLSAHSNQGSANALADTLEEKIVDMNQAVEDGQFEKVAQLADQVIVLSQRLKKQLPPDAPVAIVNGRATPGYVVFEASVAPEFLVLAQIMLGKISLAQAVEENPSLARQDGFFAWITGVISHMNVRYVSMAEAFRSWEKCPAEVAAAKDKGVITKDSAHVCVAP